MTAPVASPNQKPRNLLPAWRLKNGVMKATDGELEAAVESGEDFVWYFGGILLAGLIAEWALAIAHLGQDSLIELWVMRVANTLVLLGVGGEVLVGRVVAACQGELTRRSNERLAAANEELVRLQKKVGPRHVLIEPLLAALEGKPKPPYPVEVLYSGDDEESYLLAVQISFALSHHAKWPVAIPMPIPDSKLSGVMARAVAAHGQMSGVAISENPAPGADATLGGALKVGLLPSFGQIAWGRHADMAVGAIRIVVAPKPVR